MREGVDGLLRDKTRPSGIAPLDRKTVDTIVTLTLAPPPHETTRWTVRAMARKAKVTPSTVQKVWRAHGLAPHRWQTFELSKDPAFAQRPYDIVGLYVSPRAHAVVLSVDEKFQI